MNHNNTGIDSRLSDHFGRSIVFALSFIVTVVSVTLAGGLPFLIAIVFLGFIYYDGLCAFPSIHRWNADHCTDLQLQRYFFFAFLLRGRQMLNCLELCSSC